jgi:mono/diheme cytochrome c family protein
MPRFIRPTLIILAALALVPFAWIARARATRSDAPRLHLVQDMDSQASYRSQQANPWFADGRAMRPPVEGTLARGALHVDDAYWRGVDGGSYVERFPPEVEMTRATLERGRERYDVYCAPCHGLAGYGDGIVNARAERLQQGTWVPPASLHVEPALGRPVGHLFNTISNGIRTMPAYGAQIPVEDRWAIVGYVLALQRSQHARIEDVPAEARSALR